MAKSARLNTRWPEELLDWAKKHAQSKNTTVTQLLIDHVTSLREKEEKANGKASSSRR